MSTEKLSRLLTLAAVGLIISALPVLLTPAHAAEGTSFDVVMQNQ